MGIPSAIVTAPGVALAAPGRLFEACGRTSGEPLARVSDAGDAGGTQADEDQIIGSILPGIR